MPDMFQNTLDLRAQLAINTGFLQLLNVFKAGEFLEEGAKALVEGQRCRHRNLSIIAGTTVRWKNVENSDRSARNGRICRVLHDLCQQGSRLGHPRFPRGATWLDHDASARH